MGRMPELLTNTNDAISNHYGYVRDVWHHVHLGHPRENKDIVVYMAGQVSGMLASCVVYWVDSTRASANKDSLIRR